MNPLQSIWPRKYFAIHFEFVLYDVGVQADAVIVVAALNIPFNFFLHVINLCPITNVFFEENGIFSCQILIAHGLRQKSVVSQITGGFGAGVLGVALLALSDWGDELGEIEIVDRMQRYGFSVIVFLIC